MLVIQLIAVIGLLLGSYTSPVAASVGCQNADGRPVDWWAAIKAPKGAEYIYVDSAAKTFEFQYTAGNDLAATDDNPLAETVKQIYEQGVGSVVWNDQPPPGTIPPDQQAKHAHSKGVLGFQGDGGFYLLHSTPKFPTDVKQYKGISDCSYNRQNQPTQCDDKHGQFLYAQSYLCVSLDAENLDIVASVLRGNGLWVYGKSMAGVSMGSLPNVKAFINGDSKGLPLTVKGKPFKSRGDEEFLIFGMAPTDPDNPIYLYEELIEPTLGAGLKVQSWTEVYRFDSYCPGKCEPQGPNGPQDFMTTLNIEHITVPGTDLSWSTKKKDCAKCPGKGQEDHSKWAVTIADTSASVSVEVLCIADINRADHQLQRGGGAVCFVGQAAPGMWQLFDSLVGNDVEQCQDVCPHDNPPHIPKQFSHPSDYEDDHARPAKKPVHHRPMKTHRATKKAAAHGRPKKAAAAAVSSDDGEL